MENAVEALKMAFAVMAFMLALSVSVTSFNKVKEVSDVVLYTKDETNYYEYQGIVGKAAQNRIVGIETIIPTLYKYYKENYTVLFRTASYDETTGEFTSKIKPLPIYETPSKYKTGENRNSYYLWGKKDGEKDQSTYDTLMQEKYTPFFTDGYKELGNPKIFSFDLREETLRHEPWTGSYNATKDFIRDFLEGNAYANPNNTDQKYIYLTKDGYETINGFINKYKNKKFVETVGEYTYSSKQANSGDTEDQEGSTISSLVKEKNKRIIIYTLIEN